VFWLKSELILAKTLTLTFSPPPAAAGRKTRRLAGKKFPPLKPLHFLPDYSININVGFLNFLIIIIVG